MTASVVERHDTREEHMATRPAIASNSIMGHQGRLAKSGYPKVGCRGGSGQQRIRQCASASASPLGKLLRGMGCGVF